MKLSCPIKSNFERSTLMDVIAAFSCLFFITYGIAAFAAPNFFLGPNGLFPMFIKTSLESNDLDPITEYYMRAQGVTIIGMIVSYYLFAFGDLESERTFLKEFFVGHVAAVVTCIRWLKDDAMNEYYGSDALQYACLWSTLHVLWLGYDLLVMMPSPKEKEKALMPPNVDSAIFYSCALYVTYAAAGRAYLGADSNYFPRTPLQHNAFDPIMNAEAQFAGVWFIPGIYNLLVEAQKNPKLTYKTIIFYVILTLPITFKVIHEGYGDQRAFSIKFAADSLFMVLAFYRLGAFDREGHEHIPKSAQNIKDDPNLDMTEGMRLRDGRFIKHKAQ